MEAEIGYIVSDLVITGPERGAYKVWIPKKHGDPTSKSSYNGFGSNFGNLGSAELYQIQQVAEYCFPVNPLSSGGHMPFNEENGLMSGTEVNPDINADTVPIFTSNGQVTAIENLRFHQGEGNNFVMRQTYRASAMSQVYTPDFKGGTTLNTRPNTPAGNYIKLSLGTKVAVSGNLILGQLPQTQNDLVNQIRALNQA